MRGVQVLIRHLIRGRKFFKKIFAEWANRGCGRWFSKRVEDSETEFESGSNRSNLGRKTRANLIQFELMT
jgi:hypothetical protein